MSAFSDVSLISEPGPGALVFVFIKNTSKTATVKANVGMECGSTQVVTRIGLPDATLYPRQFEIVLPPGTKKRIGQTVFSKLLRIEPSGGVWQHLAVTFEVVGAVYSADEPRLPDPRGVAENFGCLLAPIASGGYVIQGINLNHVWGITGSIRKGRTDYAAISLSQGQSKPIGSMGPDENTVGWSLVEAKFVDNMPFSTAVPDNLAAIIGGEEATGA